jgi:hypothetical protein
MSKKVPPAEQLLHSLLRIHVPSSYFDLYEVVEKRECYELVLHEKAELVSFSSISKKDLAQKEIPYCFVARG